MVRDVKHPGGTRSPEAPAASSAKPSATSKEEGGRSVVRTAMDQFRQLGGEVRQQLQKLAADVKQATRPLQSHLEQIQFLGLKERFQTLAAATESLPPLFARELAMLAPEFQAYDTSLNLMALGRDLERVAQLIQEYRHRQAQVGAGPQGERSTAGTHQDFLAIMNEALGVHDRGPGNATAEEILSGLYPLDPEMLAYLKKNFPDRIPRDVAEQRRLLALDNRQPLENRRAAATVYEFYLIQKERREEARAWLALVDSPDLGIRSRAGAELAAATVPLPYEPSARHAIPQIAKQQVTFQNEYTPLAAHHDLRVIRDQITTAKDLIQDYTLTGNQKTAEEKFLYQLSAGLGVRIAQLREDYDPMMLEALLREIDAARRDIDAGKFDLYAAIVRHLDQDQTLAKLQTLSEEAMTVNVGRDLVREGITFAAATVATAGVSTGLELATQLSRGAEAAAATVTAARTGSHLARLGKMARPIALAAVRSRVGGAVVRQGTFLHAKAAAEIVVSGRQSLYDPSKSVLENLYNLGVGILEFELMGNFHKVFKEMWTVAPMATRASLAGKIAEFARHKGHELVRDATFFHLWSPAAGTLKTVAHGDRRHLQESVDNFFTVEGAMHTAMMTVAMGAGFGTPAARGLSRAVQRARVKEVRVVEAQQKQIQKLEQQVHETKPHSIQGLNRIAELRLQQLELAEHNAALMDAAAARHPKSEALREQAKQHHLAANNLHLAHRHAERLWSLAQTSSHEHTQRGNLLTTHDLHQKWLILEDIHDIIARRNVLLREMFTEGMVSASELTNSEAHARDLALEVRLLANTEALSTLITEMEVLGKNSSAAEIADKTASLLALYIEKRELIMEARRLPYKRFAPEVLRKVDATIKSLSHMMESPKTVRATAAKYSDLLKEIRATNAWVVEVAKSLSLETSHLRQAQKPFGKHRGRELARANEFMTRRHHIVTLYLDRMSATATLKKTVENYAQLEKRLLAAARETPTLIDPLSLLLHTAEARLYMMRLYLNTPDPEIRARYEHQLLNADGEVRKIVEAVAQRHPTLKDLPNLLPGPPKTQLLPRGPLVTHYGGIPERWVDDLIRRAGTAAKTVFERLMGTPRPSPFPHINYAYLLRPEDVQMWNKKVSELGFGEREEVISTVREVDHEASEAAGQAADADTTPELEIRNVAGNPVKISLPPHAYFDLGTPTGAAPTRVALSVAVDSSAAELRQAQDLRHDQLRRWVNQEILPLSGEGQWDRIDAFVATESRRLDEMIADLQHPLTPADMLRVERGFTLAQEFIDALEVEAARYAMVMPSWTGREALVRHARDPFKLFDSKIADIAQKIRVLSGPYQAQRVQQAQQPNEVSRKTAAPTSTREAWRDDPAITLALWHRDPQNAPDLLSVTGSYHVGVKGNDDLAYVIVDYCKDIAGAGESAGLSLTSLHQLLEAIPKHPDLFRPPHRQEDALRESVLEAHLRQAQSFSPAVVTRALNLLETQIGEPNTYRSMLRHSHGDTQVVRRGPTARNATDLTVSDADVAAELSPPSILPKPRLTPAVAVVTPRPELFEAQVDRNRAILDGNAGEILPYSHYRPKNLRGFGSANPHLFRFKLYVDAESGAILALDRNPADVRSNPRAAELDVTVHRSHVQNLYATNNQQPIHPDTLNYLSATLIGQHVRAGARPGGPGGSGGGGPHRTASQRRHLQDAKTQEAMSLATKATLGAVDPQMAEAAAVHRHRFLTGTLRLAADRIPAAGMPIRTVSINDRYLLALEPGEYEAACGLQLQLYEYRNDNVFLLATVGFQESDTGIEILRYQGGKIDASDRAKAFNRFREFSGGVAPLPWLAHLTGQILLHQAQVRGKALRFLAGERVAYGYPHHKGEVNPEIQSLADARAYWVEPRSTPRPTSTEELHNAGQRTQQLYDEAAAQLGFEHPDPDSPFHTYSKGAVAFGKAIRADSVPEQFDRSLETATAAIQKDPILGKWLSAPKLSELPPLPPLPPSLYEQASDINYGGFPFLSRLLEGARRLLPAASKQQDKDQHSEALTIPSHIAQRPRALAVWQATMQQIHNDGLGATLSIHRRLWGVTTIVDPEGFSTSDVHGQGRRYSDTQDAPIIRQAILAHVKTLARPSHFEPIVVKSPLDPVTATVEIIASYGDLEAWMDSYLQLPKLPIGPRRTTPPPRPATPPSIGPVRRITPTPKPKAAIAWTDQIDHLSGVDLVNARILQGNRNAIAEAGVAYVYEAESVGGNAGAGHMGINVQIHPTTGQIMAVGNPQSIPEDFHGIQACFRVLVPVLSHSDIFELNIASSRKPPDSLITSSHLKLLARIVSSPTTAPVSKQIATRILQNPHARYADLHSLLVNRIVDADDPRLQTLIGLPFKQTEDFGGKVWRRQVQKRQEPQQPAPPDSAGTSAGSMPRATKSRLMLGIPGMPDIRLILPEMDFGQKASIIEHQNSDIAQWVIDYIRGKPADTQMARIQEMGQAYHHWAISAAQRVLEESAKPSPSLQGLSRHFGSVQEVFDLIFTEIGKELPQHMGDDRYKAVALERERVANPLEVIMGQLQTIEDNIRVGLPLNPHSFTDIRDAMEQLQSPPEIGFDELSRDESTVEIDLPDLPPQLPPRMVQEEMRFPGADAVATLVKGAQQFLKGVFFDEGVEFRNERSPAAEEPAGTPEVAETKSTLPAHAPRSAEVASSPAANTIEPPPTAPGPIIEVVTAKDIPIENRRRLANSGTNWGGADPVSKLIPPKTPLTYTIEKDIPIDPTTGLVLEEGGRSTKSARIYAQVLNPLHFMLSQNLPVLRQLVQEGRITTDGVILKPEIPGWLRTRIAKWDASNPAYFCLKHAKEDAKARAIAEGTPPALAEVTATPTLQDFFTNRIYSVTIPPGQSGSPHVHRLLKGTKGIPVGTSPLRERG